MLGFKKEKNDKKEDVFYELFDEFIHKIIAAGEAFSDLVNNFDGVADKVANMKVMETDCDMQAHKILKKMNESEDLPFDKEDMYALTRDMDDIVDSIEEVSNRFVVFDIREMKPEAVTMAELLLQCIRELDVLFKNLKDIKTNPAVMTQIIEVNRIENEGDIVYRRALTKLFRTEENPIEVLKWKELFDVLEDSLDACENVANIVEGLVMKHGRA